LWRKGYRSLLAYSRARANSRRASSWRAGRLDHLHPPPPHKVAPESESLDRLKTFYQLKWKIIHMQFQLVSLGLPF
jgi:hypothetical protein